MKLNTKSLMILALCGLLVGCGNKNTTKVADSPYALLNGRKAKKTYESLAGIGIGSLYYTRTSAAQNAQHFANFVDGLVTHNEFGVLELNLAESASHNEDYSSYTFKVRNDENNVWVTYQGKPYVFDGETQYVKAADFKTAALGVCTYFAGISGGGEGGSLYYLYTDYVQGAAEYLIYTQILDAISQGGSGEMAKADTDAKKAKIIQKTLKSTYPTAYLYGRYESNPVTAEAIPNIANGSRFGVVVDEAANTVTYNLLTSMMFFPTMLTYSCYLPLNANFYNENKSSFGKTSPDSILYCGPYYLSELDETTIVYKRNKYYHKRADLADKKSKGYQKARIETVRYNIIKGDVDASYTRVQFESGNIDGFGLSLSDTEGWKKYVTGPDAGAGYDHTNPYDGLVNSRLLDTIGSCYGTNINMERSGNSAKSYSSFTTASDNENTKRALRLQDVRQAIMDAYDYPTYYARYADGDSTSVFARQELVHTYVPKNFVTDDNGNEYTETYYAKALADYKGISLDDAKKAIEPGQFDTRQKSKDEVLASCAKAQAAIDAYNASDFAVSDGSIATPIIVELYSVWDASAEDKNYDIKMINAMNKRLNNVDEIADNYANCNFIRIVPTDEVDSNNYSDVSQNAAFDFAPVAWGWGADYGDPQTYMNTYVKGGDWSSIFGYIDDEYVTNYRWNAGHTALEKVDLLKEYTDIVSEGKKETTNLFNRYTKFAEAEVKLINELAIYMPQVNRGQGWSLSISKSAGYEMPTANYGLSSDRLTGMWVLVKPLTRAERAEIRAEFDANKEAYTSSHPSYNIYG